MADFPGDNYAPPGVYVDTVLENPSASVSNGTLLPVLIGVGRETLDRNNFEVVRGSSAAADTPVVDEDLTGRAATSAGVLGDWNGSKTRFQTRNYPIVTGDGTGTATTDRSHVIVKVNGTQVVVKSVTGSTGFVELVSAPATGAQVTCSYSFDRTDVSQSDDVSSQVTRTAAILTAEIGGPYTVSALAGNNLFVVTSDRASAKTYTIPDGTYTAAQLATLLNTGAPGTLVASAVRNASNLSTLRLTSDESLVIGAGTANTVLGLAANQATSRNTQFRVFNGPVTDGSGSGVATTNPVDVNVTINGVSVTATSVDGVNRLVTLPYAPAAGSTVVVSYRWNSWQDTFDYLGNSQVLSVSQCGDAPGLSSYIPGTDFLLQDDKIVWGSAALVSEGTTASGTAFNTQVSTTLVDDRSYLAVCTVSQDSSVSPPVVDRSRWTLPHQPTTGNGRDTPLGSTLYGNVSNGRLDLATDRPDLVTAYWGFSLEDALVRGAVTVLEVDSATSTLRLADPVPAGASVWATYWYNNLVDANFTLTSKLAGVSGVGTYGVEDESGNDVYAATFGSKGIALANVTVVTPSGAERTIDARLEPSGDALYSGAVEEIATVEFANTIANPARFTGTGTEDFGIEENASDKLVVTADGTTFVAGGIDLSDPTGSGAGFFATLVGTPVAYTAASGSTTYVIDSTNDSLTVQLDGVELVAKAEQDASSTVESFVTALNRAAKGEAGTTAGAGNVGKTTAVLGAAASSDHNDLYVGWELTLTSGTNVGETRTVSAYDAGTQTVTVSAAYSNQVAGSVAYLLSNPATRPVYKGATRFTSSVVIAANEHDDIQFRYVGSTSGASGTLTATVADATYATASDLAAAVQTGFVTAIGGLGAGFLGLKVTVTADADGRLVFGLRRAQADASGYLEFITGTAALDFAQLAGVDTSTSGGGQAKLVDGDVARRFTVGSVLEHDRLVVRSRLVPGRGSLYGQQDSDQSSIVVLAGNGNTLAGLEAGNSAYGSYKAAVKPATLRGQVAWTDGQSSIANDGKGLPAVKFYSAGANKNTTWSVNIDGTTHNVTFSGSAGGTLTPLGPVTVASSVLGQIVAQTTGLTQRVSLEGNGIRITSGRSDSQSLIQLGTGNANATLGFSNNQTASRTLVSASIVASALMAHSHATIATTLNTWATLSAGNYFATRALAWAQSDESNQKYLAFQSLTVGTSSTLAFASAAAEDALAYGVGLGIVDGDSAAGEAARSGFFVTSSDPAGSGSANDSILNSGVGQDGVVGQTYRDKVTGLTFTVLTREGGQPYPTGSTATFTLRVSRTLTTNANVPVRVLGGLELTVANTSGVTAGNTALVQTFERQGTEPAIGEPYYVSYTYQKQDFGFKTYRTVAEIEAQYGEVSPDNPLSLAAYLAILNGASNVAIKQIDTNGAQVASETQIRAAIESLVGQQIDGNRADMLVPVISLSDSMLQYIQKHCEVQSSKRYASERTALVGFYAGKDPNAVIATARTLKSSRVRLVYPDTIKLPLTDSLGRSKTYLVDGFYAAAALVGSIVNPSYDVATPWENRVLRGLSGSARVLDAVTMNQIAQAGITVLEDRRGVLRVRHGLTTDMTSILTKTPTVALISDEVQKRMRAALDPFIGIKLLPGVLNQIEGIVSKVLGDLIDEQIIIGYRGVRATVSPDDPTVIDLSASYAPVFPVLYIDFRLGLRATLD
jgi:hypothetical protein